MARALPLLFCALFVGASAIVSSLDYAAAVAAHAWTGATFVIAFGVVFGVLAGVIGWFFGRAVRDLAAPGGDKKRPALIAAVIVLFTAYLSVSTVLNRRREARLQAIRAEALTPERARLLADAGTPPEKRALAYNRSCPGALLRELSLDSDYAVRASVAANPATPADVARKLALDPNESVRLYAESHPALRK